MAIHLLDLLSPAQPILYNAVFAHLEPLDALRLLATCRTIQALKPLLWSINRSLRRFVSDPLAFRSLMAKHNAIVSGSHALQFLARIYWSESDLDVYITGGLGLQEFAKHLIEREGYIYSPYSWQSDNVKAAMDKRREEGRAHIKRVFDFLTSSDPEDETNPLDEMGGEISAYSSRQIDGVFNFVHRTNPNRRIQLIGSRKAPLAAVLADYYATHIFNFFTWNAAYSLFPRHTLIDKQAYYTNSLTDRSRLGVSKYKDRGYRFLHYGEYHKCVKTCPFRPHRRVGDAYSWVMKLDTTGVEISKDTEPMDVMLTTTWGMKMHRSWWSGVERQRMFRAESHIRILFGSDQTECFQYMHLYDNHSTSWPKFLTEMQKLLAPMGKYQVGFDGDKQKDWMDEDAFWMDDQFAAWYRFWEESIMPYDNVWEWQYPMLGDGVTVPEESEEESDAEMTGQYASFSTVWR
ncbi:hypothetical protein TWF696_004587 [Orbilia brochopaga]|uniref:F-box domain-containing protein n=1 Tax=Orbilia brochopaga TaxID=3140254 RepID=A0AAV9V9D5_9PEZI